MSKSEFTEVTRDNPCPACGKSSWCAWTAKGWLKCENSTTAPAGMISVKPCAGGALFKPVENASRTRRRQKGGEGRPGGSGGSLPKPHCAFDGKSETDAFVAALSDEKRALLATDLDVTVAALRAVQCGWATGDDLRRLRASGAGWQEAYPDGAFTFPERGGDGRVVGFSLRAMDGRKGSPSKAIGAKRGLCVPSTIKDATGTILVVEGASDVAAATVLGICAVGRPSCSGGGEALSEMLRGRQPLVVGENDCKEFGAWPGRDGAERVAQRLANDWETPVSWTLPPGGAKDIRAYLHTQVVVGLNLTDSEACKAAGAELIRRLLEAAQEVEPEATPKQSELIVRLALEQYRIGLSDGDEPFAVPNAGPNVALMFRGSRDSIKAKLAKAYRDRYRSVPSGTAISEALMVLQGDALDQAPEPVHLRVARWGEAVVLDLGDSSGSAVVIEGGSWELVDQSPVLFRRTALTKELPAPVRGGDFTDLKKVLNVDPADWPLLLGFLVAAFVPDSPHPLLLLGGEQGTGKTTAARYLMGLFDPSTAEVRSAPRDPEQWAITTAGSWGLVLDNISHIPEWLSDALCKASTGDGWLRRTLYSDSGISVLAFRRVMILTSIDPGALRGDLGDRLLLVDLEKIEDSVRQPLKKMDAAYAAMRPGVLGAILDLVAKVLPLLDTVKFEKLPRMADFAVILTAMDCVLGTKSFELFLNQRSRIAGDVVDADEVGHAITTFMNGVGEWSGTMKELLQKIIPSQTPKGWPKNGKALSGHVRRLAPSLRAIGIEVHVPPESDKTRRYTFKSSAATAQTAQPPDSDGEVPARPTNGGSQQAPDRAVDAQEGPDRPSDRPKQNGDGKDNGADSGRSGGLGGRSTPKPKGDVWHEFDGQEGA